ncbi:MAG TPA: Ig-like domain-containing protein [Candidatus Parabacteroides faecavium]|nr:Ig-like domain-containing protein [Candidatus Parabacteroides faecavium]
MNGYQYRCVVINSAGSVTSDAATLTVNAATVSVTGVTLEPTSLSLFTGDTAPLTATVQPSDATNQNVTWSSDKPEVATVDNGKVTAVGAGEATITATAGGITATCVVHVRKPATVEASGSTNLSFTTDRNEFTLTAIVYGENLSQEPNCWEWTVANTDVVSLSDTPNLRSGSVASSRKAFTIKGTGTTTITATYDDGTYRGSVDFKVRISKPTPPDPISYYNIYVEDVCDGVEVSTSKQVVREGGSINVYVEKDTARYTFDNFKVYYKRSYYGVWDELKEGTQPGEYPIKNIWTHIYIKAEGAEEKEDPTGIESIEGVKVYTKDGSLYVQTPQREQVIIVSMSGAVVKNEEQIGLKQYHGLQPGIYIVRVGDRAYKVRLN